MSKIYTRKGNYRDGLASFLNYLGYFMLLAGGPGFTLVFLMGHLGGAPAGMMHLPVYVAFVVPVLGLYFVRAAKRRAYGDDPLFSIRPIGIMLVILQALMIVELILDKTYDVKSLLICLIPAIFAFPIFFKGCKKKVLVVAILLMALIPVILLMNLDKLLHEIPGKGLLVIVAALAILWFAISLLVRRKKHMTPEEEEFYI